MHQQWTHTYFRNIYTLSWELSLGLMRGLDFRLGSVWVIGFRLDQAIGLFLKIGWALNNGSHFRGRVQAFRLQPKAESAFRLPFGAKMAQYHIFLKFLATEHCFGNKWGCTTFSSTRTPQTQVPYFSIPPRHDDMERWN